MGERNLHRGLFRVEVTADGNLAYSFFADAPFLGRVGMEDGIVPEEVVAQGAQAVTEYIDAVIADIRKRNTEAHAAYRQRRDSTRVFINLVHKGQKLRGVMTTPTRRGGLACFDISLTSPKKYCGTETLYEHKYIRKGLIDKEGNHTELALQEAQKALARIYAKRHHELQYAEVYTLAREVKAQLVE